jgi:hypothetical protein
VTSPRAEHAPLGREERRRVAVFCVLALLMISVPMMALCTDHPLAQHAGWRMFRTNATRICVVRYDRARADGSYERLDHLTLLGFRDGRNVPLHVARITDPEAADYYAQALCARLGRGADVRMRLRCASETGYDVLASGRESACR